MTGSWTAGHSTWKPCTVSGRLSCWKSILITEVLLYRTLISRFIRNISTGGLSCLVKPSTHFLQVKGPNGPNGRENAWQKCSALKSNITKIINQLSYDDYYPIS